VVTELAQKGNLENVELTLRRKNGEFINTLSSGEVITLDGQRFILSFFFDITEHKRAEEVLRESEERFRAIFEGNTDGMLIADPQNKAFVMGNPAICRMLACRLEEIPTMGVANIHRQEDMPFVLDHFERLVSGRENTGEDVPVKRKDGSVFFADVTANPITLSGKTYVVGSFRDITERKRAENEIRRSRDELEFRVQERTEALAKSQERLQDLASQLLLAQEKERKRVAVELHDGLMSELAATKFLLEGKIKTLDNGKAIKPEELRRIAEVLAGTMKEARRIMNNLHPSLLDELGLIATIRWFCGEFQKSNPHIAVQQEILVSEGGISRGIRVVIYRVLQEALNNFARHGNGDRVEVSLSKPDGTFTLAIRDNGRGFDVGNTGKGLGLGSMQERVELSGGEFQIESTLGQGTTIRGIWRLL
jgi:PAS domain S-box-containing protein